MTKLQSFVKAFHEKNGFPIGGRLTDCKSPSIDGRLNNYGHMLVEMSQFMLGVFKTSGDQRSLRCHLMLEELGETMIAMASRDEVGMLDGLGDLLYVLLGTGETFDLPVEDAFIEIHTSNMTKAVQKNDPDRVRLRDKGPDYIAPDIAGVLKKHRDRHDMVELLLSLGSDITA